MGAPFVTLMAALQQQQHSPTGSLPPRRDLLDLLVPVLLFAGVAGVTFLVSFLLLLLTGSVPLGIGGGLVVGGLVVKAIR